MRIAYVIFDGITWLDMVGIYDPISRLRSLHYLPDLRWDICGFTNMVSDNFGLTVKPDKIQNSFVHFDAIIVPGGFGTRKLQYDKDFLSWVKTSENVPYKISVCTGSLILGACGFLQDKRATTNYREYDALKPYCKEVIAERIVEDGDVITAGAVSASLDLGLHLCAKWGGVAAKEEIRKRMDYQ